MQARSRWRGTNLGHRAEGQGPIGRRSGVRTRTGSRYSPGLGHRQEVAPSCTPATRTSLAAGCRAPARSAGRPGRPRPPPVPARPCRRLMSTATVAVMTRSTARNCRSPRLVLTCQWGGGQDRLPVCWEDLNRPEKPPLRRPLVPCLWNPRRSGNCWSDSGTPPLQPPRGSGNCWSDAWDTAPAFPGAPRGSGEGHAR